MDVVAEDDEVEVEEGAEMEMVVAMEVFFFFSPFLSSLILFLKRLTRCCELSLPFSSGLSIFSLAPFFSAFSQMKFSMLRLIVLPSFCSISKLKLKSVSNKIRGCTSGSKVPVVPCPFPTSSFA